MSDYTLIEHACLCIPDACLCIFVCVRLTGPSSSGEAVKNLELPLSTPEHTHHSTCTRSAIQTLLASRCVKKRSATTRGLQQQEVCNTVAHASSPTQSQRQTKAEPETDRDQRQRPSNSQRQRQRQGKGQGQRVCQRQRA